MSIHSTGLSDWEGALVVKPKATSSTGLPDWEHALIVWKGALVVKPKVAWKLLDCSNTRGYELIATGELDSFRDGRSRKILVASIYHYIIRRLALTGKSVSTDLARQLAPTDNSVSTNAQLRRRGRPRKSFVQERMT